MKQGERRDSSKDDLLIHVWSVDTVAKGDVHYEMSKLQFKQNKKVAKISRVR